MVERLSRGPASVSELARPFDMSLAAVVRHVQVLEASGIVRPEKVGRIRTCRIEPAAPQRAEHWIAERRTAWEDSLDRLGAYLAENPEDPSNGEMSERSVVYANFVIERTYEASPARVFRAWSEPTAKARWFAGAETGTRLRARLPGGRAGGQPCISVSVTTVELRSEGTGND